MNSKTTAREFLNSQPQIVGAQNSSADKNGPHGRFTYFVQMSAIVLTPTARYSGIYCKLVNVFLEFFDNMGGGKGVVGDSEGYWKYCLHGRTDKTWFICFDTPNQLFALDFLWWENTSGRSASCLGTLPRLAFIRPLFAEGAPE